jgi:small subunit ribosomal protein S20
MPQHKSAAKRMRTNATSRERNKPRMARVRKAVKAVRTAPDKDSAGAGLKTAASLLDRAASKRTLHKNKASRLKSRLSKTVNSMGS